MVEFVVIAACP